jgi:ABC-type lipoprotein export system ATPase subunit
MVFVIGKSGCGKTTLLNVMGGLDGVDSGEIFLFDKKFSSFSQSEYDDYRNTFIGFIFQEYNLLSEFTVQKNIEIAMEIQGKKGTEEDVDALLSEMEISSLKNRKINELSGGQRQRVAIARALVKQPRIILADEPTGALDSSTGEQVLDILKKLSKNKLVIVVSHDKEFAEKYADRIIRLVDGQVAEDVSFENDVIDENVCEIENELYVKGGADLSEEDLKTVATAVKNNKKIQLV